MQAGETAGASEDGLSPLEFSINPERVAPLLRRLVTPSGPHHQLAELVELQRARGVALGGERR